MKLQLLEEIFTNEKGEEVAGVTMIVEGEIKQVMDVIMKVDPRLRNYKIIFANMLINGLNHERVEYKNDELLIFEDDMREEGTEKEVKGIRIMVTGGLKVILDD